MAPSGGYKGFGIGLLVEILASAASGALPSTEASPFSGPAGGPPRTGQFFLAIAADGTSGGLFAERVEALAAAISEQPGARLQGGRRAAARRRTAADGIQVPADLVARINDLGK